MQEINPKTGKPYHPSTIWLRTNPQAQKRKAEYSKSDKLLEVAN